MADTLYKPRVIVLKPPVRDMKMLFTIALNRWSYDEAEVRMILKKLGHSSFKLDMFDKYVTDLEAYHIQSVMTANFPGWCPICDGVIGWNKRQHQFGAKIGWECFADKTHFWKYRALQHERFVLEGKQRMEVNCGGSGQ